MFIVDVLALGTTELKEYMRKHSKLSSYAQMADFHLLLYLSKLPSFNLEEDVTVIVEAVKHKANIPEGYTMIIESLCM
jgi:hypothetical protein